jgi:hypothetical protein
VHIPKYYVGVISRTVSGQILVRTIREAADVYSTSTRRSVRVRLETVERAGARGAAVRGVEFEGLGAGNDRAVFPLASLDPARTANVVGGRAVDCKVRGSAAIC